MHSDIDKNRLLKDNKDWNQNSVYIYNLPNISPTNNE